MKNGLFAIMGAVVGLAGWGVCTAQATNFTWTAGGGASRNWDQTANWNPSGGVPGANDTAVFTGTANRVVGIGASDQTVSNVIVTGSAVWTWSNSVNKLTVGNGGFIYSNTASSVFDAKLGGSGALTVYGGTLRLTNQNDFGGGSFVESGLLRVKSDPSAGTGPVTLGSAHRIAALSVLNPIATPTNTVIVKGAGGRILGQDLYAPAISHAWSGSGQFIYGPFFRSVVTNLTSDNALTGPFRFQSAGGGKFDGYVKLYGIRNVTGSGDVRLEMKSHVQVETNANFGSGASVYVEGLYPGFPEAWYPLCVSYLGLEAQNGFLPTLHPDSSGVLALYSLYTHENTPAAFNAKLADGAPQLGNGYMRYGTGSAMFSNGSALERRYTGASLQPNLDGVYRFQLNGGTLVLRSTNGIGPLRADRGVDVSGMWSASGGIVLANASNDFTGTLTVRNHGTFAGAFYLPNTPFGHSTGAVHLSQGQLMLSSFGNYSQNYSKGLTTFSGQSRVWVQVPSANYTNRLALANIERLDGGMLGVYPNTSRLALNERVVATNGIPSSNGMVAPYFVESRNGTFLDYVAPHGFTNAVFDYVNDLTTPGSADIVDINAVTALAGDKEIYALRSATNITGSATLSLGSGGLILKGGNIGVPLNFTNSEALVSVFSDSIISGPVIGTNGLTLGGDFDTARVLTLSADNSTTLKGRITLNMGHLAITNDNALGDPANELFINGGIGNQSTAAGAASLKGVAAGTAGVILTNRPIVIGPNGGTLWPSGSGRLTVESPISGSGILGLVSASGPININNPGNSYTGGTWADVGAATLSVNGTLGTGPLLVSGVDSYVRLYRTNSVHTTAPVAIVRFYDTEGTVVRVRFDAVGVSRIGSLYGNGNVILGAAGTVLALGGNNAATEFFGQISEGAAGGSLIKEGTNTFTLWGDSTYSGTTTVQRGTLLVNGLLSSHVLVTNAFGDGALLGGTGLIASNVTVTGGTLTAGEIGTAGSLQINGSLTLDAASTLRMDVGGGTTNDALVVGGAVTLGGTLNVNLLNGHQMGNDETRTLISAAGGFGGTKFTQVVPDNLAVTYAPNEILLRRNVKGSVFMIR